MSANYRNRRPSVNGKRGHLLIGEHVIIAEKAIGKSLPPGAVVHHVDCDGKNNDHDNLVICPNQTYHALLHLRQRAFDACGNANWRKCPFCKEWDDPDNMYTYIPKKYQQPRGWHRECALAYNRARRAAGITPVRDGFGHRRIPRV